MKVVVVNFGFEDDVDAEEFADGIVKGEPIESLPKWQEAFDSHVEDP